MLERYVEAGLDPDAFWHLTPRIYSIHMRGAGARMERQQEIADRQAYNIAKLLRPKLPPYDKVFRKITKPTPGARQSPVVLQAMCDALMVQWGGTFDGSGGNR